MRRKSRQVPERRGIDLGSRPVTLNFTPTAFAGDSTHPALYVSSGILNINSAITVVNNGASPLGNGTYVVIKAANASTTGTPTLSGNVVGGLGLVSGKNALIQRNVSTGDIELTVQDALTPTVTLTRNISTVNNSTYGDALQFDVNVTGSGATPTGSVDLRDGSPSGTILASGALTSGAATLSPALNAVTAGTHTLYAVYSGDSTYLVVNNTLSQTVLPLPVTVTGASAIGKMFDNNTTATLTGGIVSPIVAGDTATEINANSGTFANVGPGSGIGVTGILSGTKASSYSLASPPALTADILATATWTSTATPQSWDTAANWLNSIVGTGSGNTADFSTVNLTADTVVNLTTPRTIGSLVFGDTDTSTAASWTLANNGSSGNKLILAGTTPTVTVNALGTGAKTTISAVVDGTAGLTKAGVGTLALSGANTYSGGTVVNSGVLTFNTDSALGATSSNITLNGGTLASAATNLTLGSARSLTIGASGGTLAHPSTGLLNYGGVIGGSGLLTLNVTAGGGSGIALSGQSTNSGGTILTGSSGSFVYMSASSTGVPGSLVSGPLGTGTVTFNGPGTRSTITTDTTVGNDLIFAADATFATVATEKTLTLTGPVTLSGNRTLTVNVGTTVAGKNVTFTNAISDGGNTYSLTKAGTGNLVLSGVNTYTGTTTISAGTLTIGDGSIATSSNIVNSAALVYSLNANARTYANVISGTGSLTKTGTNTLTLTGVNTYTGATTISTGQLTIDDGSIATSSNIVNNAALEYKLNTNARTYANAITGSGTLTKSGTNTLTLSGTNTYTGGTTINSGTLQVSGGSAIANSGLVTLADVAGVTFQVVGSETVGALSGGGAIGGAVSIDASQTLTLSLASGTQTYAGKVSGAGTLTYSGGAATNQVLSGPLSHTGAVNGVNVTAGVLTLGSSSNTHTGTTTISAAGGLLVTANGALGAVGTGHETTVTGPASGTGGSLGFSGSINYSSVEKINGSGNGSAALLGGVFTDTQRGFIQSVIGNNTFAGAIEVTGNSRIGTQNGAQLTLTGVITQTTGNIVFRAGNNAGDFVTLSNAGNSFGGNSTVFTSLATPGSYAGVRLGITNGLPTNLTITGFGSGNGIGTALDLAGYDQTLNGVATGAGGLSIVNMNTGTPSTLTLNPTADKTSSNTLVLGGGALGVINLVKDGSFTQTLSGANTYTGTTTVNAGTLTLGNASALGTASASVSGGSLDLGGQSIANAVSVGVSGSLTGNGTINGAATLAGNLTPGGSGSGLITMASATVASTSSIALQLAAAGTRGTNYDALTVSAALALDGTITVSLNGLTPAAGQSFDLINSDGSIDVTNFTVASDLVLPALSGGLIWDRSAFASTGVVSIVNGDPYIPWATAKGLTGLSGSATDPAKSADPDGDGKNNLYEFAFDGDPLSGGNGGNDGKIVGKIATIGADQVLTLTLPVRGTAPTPTFSNDSGDQLSALIDGIYYRIEGDETLSPFADTITEITAITAGLPPLSTGWTYRTFRAPGSVLAVPKAFLRAKVSETP